MYTQKFNNCNILPVQSMYIISSACYKLCVGLGCLEESGVSSGTPPEN